MPPATSTPLQNNTGEIRGTRFTPDATRIENGRLYTEIEKGFKRGYYRFNERVRREHLLVDEERQVVMSRGFIDHKGVLDTYVTTDGETIRSIYREPHTWGFLEMFKVNDDKITGVQAVFIRCLTTWVRHGRNEPAQVPGRIGRHGGSGWRSSTSTRAAPAPSCGPASRRRTAASRATALRRQHR